MSRLAQQEKDHLSCLASLKFFHHGIEECVRFHFQIVNPAFRPATQLNDDDILFRRDVNELAEHADRLVSPILKKPPAVAITERIILIELTELKWRSGRHGR